MCKDDSNKSEHITYDIQMKNDGEQDIDELYGWEELEKDSSWKEIVKNYKGDTNEQ